MLKQRFRYIWKAIVNLLPLPADGGGPVEDGGDPLLLLECRGKEDRKALELCWTESRKVGSLTSSRSVIYHSGMAEVVKQIVLVNASTGADRQDVGTAHTFESGAYDLREVRTQLAVENMGRREAELVACEVAVLN
jgi:hypothetical protein